MPLFPEPMVKKRFLSADFGIQLRQDLIIHTLKEVSYETVSDYILSERYCPYVYGSGKSAKAADRMGVSIKVET